MNDEELLKQRIRELSKRAFSQGRYQYSEFLDMAQQDLALRTDTECDFTLYGGYGAAERKIAVFGDSELCGYEAEMPIVCMKIEPETQKYADVLSHRDFLGSLMALGIRRSVLGDIVIHENTGYLFCLSSIAGYIAEELRKVRHTNVRCQKTEELPEEAVKLPELSEVVVASERLDALVAAVYRLSRGASQQLFEQKKVFLNSRMVEKPSEEAENGSIVSVRGYGRFLYEGIRRETKKGRLRAAVRVF